MHLRLLFPTSARNHKSLMIVLLADRGLLLVVFFALNSSAGDKPSIYPHQDKPPRICLYWAENVSMASLSLCISVKYWMISGIRESPVITTKFFSWDASQYFFRLLHTSTLNYQWCCFFVHRFLQNARDYNLLFY
jgi:hypothetical protein